MAASPGVRDAVPTLLAELLDFCELRFDPGGELGVLCEVRAAMLVRLERRTGEALWEVLLCNFGGFSSPHEVLFGNNDVIH